MRELLLTTSMTLSIRVVIFSCCISLLTLGAEAQVSSTQSQDSSTSVASAKAPSDQDSGLERHIFTNLVKDQATIWTSPFRVRGKELNWIVPFVSATAALVGTDHEVMNQVQYSSSSLNRFKQVSDAGLYGAIGVSGMLYGVGILGKNPHARETGWLAGEAVLNGLAVNTVTQKITNRNRPNALVNEGKWWQSGPSFPSDHSMAAWSVATIVASEYPGKATKVLAYGTAATVSITRVLARQHSPSDVFVGSAIGILIGQQIYRTRHRDLSVDRSFGTFVKSDEGSNDWLFHAVRSPYVPIDSDIYSQLDYLIAGGFIDTSILGQRPWTRSECARLVEEAASSVTDKDDALSVEMLKHLRDEFAVELGDSTAGSEVPVEEVYVRTLGISGTPLRDSYHFGQTLYNDYGRPYWRGANVITGASGSGAWGPFSLHLRGEYQYSPERPAYSSTVAGSLAGIDATSAPILPDTQHVSQFRLIEGYASTEWKNLGLSVGKQSLWWGPSASGPWLFSDNAEPIYMARLTQVSPIRLPSIFGYLGPFKFDAFYGKLAEHAFPAHPYLHGQKVSFKPTRNLEFGFSRTVMFAGDGHPLTLKSFWRSFSSIGDNLSTIPGSANDVGDRRGGFDFSYRLPYLRDRVTIYGDFFTDDDPSPVSAPQRAAFNPGIYISRIPGIPRLDLRVEAPTSDQAAVSNYHGTFFYYNGAYRDGYTSKRMLIGNWAGRDSKSIYAVSRLHLRTDRVLEMRYRHSTIDPGFIPNGGNLTDGRLGFDTKLASVVSLSSFIQWERWNVPMLSSKPENNVTASVELRLRPVWHKK